MIDFMVEYWWYFYSVSSILTYILYRFNFFDEYGFIIGVDYKRTWGNFLARLSLSLVFGWIIIPFYILFLVIFGVLFSLKYIIDLIGKKLNINLKQPPKWL